MTQQETITDLLTALENLLGAVTLRATNKRACIEAGYAAVTRAKVNSAFRKALKSRPWHTTC